MTANAPLSAASIPFAHTPPGGYGAVMPPPVLAGCSEPLVAGAPNLRGMWRTVRVEVNGVPVSDHPQVGNVQRIEQAGDRITITSGGVVHDMRADGTVENGVNDVAAADKTTRISVVATYEDGVHVLRPVGVTIEVTRRLDGAELRWDHVGFTAWCERIADPA